MFVNSIFPFSQFNFVVSNKFTFKFSANATRVDFGLQPPNVGRMFSNNFDAGLVRAVGHL